MFMINIESKIWFNRLPTEIIFLIFDYLSNNDIIYTFFFFSKRFNDLLLQNQRYFKYLQLPTTNLSIWKQILALIGSETEYLNINTTDLTFLWKYFSNIKSINITSSYGLAAEQAKQIVCSKHFLNLHTLRIKDNEIFSNQWNNSDSILKKVFNYKNILHLFQCSLIIPPLSLIYIENFQTNFNLHSLILTLTDFKDIFVLISYTPNLIYLNVHSNASDSYKKPMKTNDIKLKQLHLTFNDESNKKINFDEITNPIKYFSSSLICLSLNAIALTITRNFNSTKLRQFLESMLELKQFHLYVKLNEESIDIDNLLFEFQNKYWFDHNWSFGIHREYFYTLPFYFDYLYEFLESFNDVRSNNLKILENNSQIWRRVKSIDLPRASQYNFRFLNELNTKMPELTYIKFGPYCSNHVNQTDNISVKNDQRENSLVLLYNVRVIECIIGCLDNEWLIYALPNLKHLILSETKLPPVDSELTEILNKRIERLNIDVFSGFEQLKKINEIYFSNVQHINLNLNNNWKGPKWYANNIENFLKTFENLKTLFIYMNETKTKHMDPRRITDLSKLGQYLNTKKIMTNYRVNFFPQCLLFSKANPDDDQMQQDMFAFISRNLSGSFIKNWFSN